MEKKGLNITVIDIKFKHGKPFTGITIKVDRVSDLVNIKKVFPAEEVVWVYNSFGPEAYMKKKHDFKMKNGKTRYQMYKEEKKAFKLASPFVVGIDANRDPYLNNGIQVRWYSGEYAMKVEIPKKLYLNTKSLGIDYFVMTQKRDDHEREFKKNGGDPFKYETNCFTIANHPRRLFWGDHLISFCVKDPEDFEQKIFNPEKRYETI